jgi:peptidoglycan/LPS O-acetylase OafA/YrhL
VVGSGDGTRRIQLTAALDGARGAAVAGVLLFHGGHLLGGYLGVDFFFTLSGFLITSLLLAESSSMGSIGRGGFWARRARRLLPALGVLLGGVAIYCLTFATPGQMSTIRGDAIATIGYVANWREVFSHQDYFARFTAPSPLNHTWSLAIEEQFYVVWPLVFVGLLAWRKRATPKAVLVTSLVLAATSSALAFAMYDPTNVARDYFGTDTRATAILLGAALAAWLSIHGPTAHHGRRIALEILGVASALVLAVAWTRLDGESSTLYHGGLLACALAATAVIAAAVHPVPGPISRALSLRPLCALGVISYGVYLYHWPIDVVFEQQRDHIGFEGWPLLAMEIAATLAVAAISFRFIEHPIRHGALTSAQVRKLTPAIAIGLVVVLVAATSGGKRPSDARAGFAEAAAASRPHVAAATRAARLAAPGSRRVMVAGDSVAYFLAQDFQKLRTDPPLAVFNEGILGCQFLPVPLNATGTTRAKFHDTYGSHTQRAFPCNHDWEARAVKAFDPDVVFWVVSNPVDALLSPDGWLDACSAAYASAYHRTLSRAVATYGSEGAKVVITTAVYPRYPGAAEDRPTDCENVIRRRVAASTGAQLVDMQAYICPGGKCRTKQDGVTLRVDGEHYKGPGGRLVATWLLNEVDE